MHYNRQGFSNFPVTQHSIVSIFPTFTMKITSNKVPSLVDLKQQHAREYTFIMAVGDTIICQQRLRQITN